MLNFAVGVKVGAARFPREGSLLDHNEGSLEGNKEGERDDGALAGTVLGKVITVDGAFDNGCADGSSDGTCNARLGKFDGDTLVGTPVGFFNVVVGDGAGIVLGTMLDLLLGKDEESANGDCEGRLLLNAIIGDIVGATERPSDGSLLVHAIGTLDGAGDVEANDGTALGVASAVVVGNTEGVKD